MYKFRSSPRQQAEAAFSETQTQFFARNKAIEEYDAQAHSLAEKTQRLREARLAKETHDRETVKAALITKRAGKA